MADFRHPPGGCFVSHKGTGWRLKCPVHVKHQAALYRIRSLVHEVHYCLHRLVAALQDLFSHHLLCDPFNQKRSGIESGTSVCQQMFYHWALLTYQSWINLYATATIQRASLHGLPDGAKHSYCWSYSGLEMMSLCSKLRHFLHVPTSHPPSAIKTQNNWSRGMSRQKHII